MKGTLRGCWPTRPPTGIPPLRLAPPDWRGFPDLLSDWRAGSQS